eukprot:scaffold13277_cov114-Isochrysis_galbana.AAC.5
MIDSDHTAPPPTREAPAGAESNATRRRLGADGWLRERRARPTLPSSPWRHTVLRPRPPPRRPGSTRASRAVTTPSHGGAASSAAAIRSGGLRPWRAVAAPVKAALGAAASSVGGRWRVPRTLAGGGHAARRAPSGGAAKCLGGRPRG